MKRIKVTEHLIVLLKTSLPFNNEDEKSGFFPQALVLLKV
jgi:hypothetical protein